MNLTDRQRDVLRFIKDFMRSRGYPPTVREVARKFGYRSPLAAKQHIDALVRKGYLRRAPGISRGLSAAEAPQSPETLTIPVVGTIRAGTPILATEQIEEYLRVSRDLFPLEEGFGLRVVGDSMKGAGIMEGDIVVIRGDTEVRNGDIVVALLQDEATVKRLFFKDGFVVLMPEHPEMKPIKVSPEDVKILGKVVGLIRRF